MKNWLTFFILMLFGFSIIANPEPADNNRYVERAKRKMSENNYAEALDALRKANERQPDTFEIYNLMGDCNRKLGNYAEATKNYAYAKTLSSRKDNILVEGIYRLSKLF